MCYGENNAPHAASYFNTQLTGLWEIADECADHYLGEDRHDLKPEETQERYAIALAAFHYGRHRQGPTASRNDMMFYASFKPPQLKFICNHEAFFQLEVAEGHFNLDHHRATESTTAESGRNRSIAQNALFTFRVPFGTTGIQGSATMIGNGNHLVNLLVLDYRRAKLIGITPEVDAQSFQALEFYFRVYLVFLHCAGCHVLFTLPNFSDAKDELLIDYSEVIEHELRLQEVHGVAIADINRYLATSWLKAAMLASGPEGQVYDRPGISLAEFRSTWLSQRAEINFYFTFGPPDVAALCSDEIIVHYVIDEALFFQYDKVEGDPWRKYGNWRIAVVFKLIYEEPQEEDGNVRRCRVDMATARLLTSCSKFDGLSEGDNIDTYCRRRAVEFITNEYLESLESGKFDIIYEHDRRWTAQADEIDAAEEFISINEASWSATDVIEDASGKTTKTAIWRDIIQHSDMCGFDQVTALSETAINHSFYSLSANHALLKRWQYDSYFVVNFRPPTVRLRSDGRVYITFHMKDGTVKGLKNWQLFAGAESQDFSNWRVTFEVGLRICDHAEIPGIDPLEWRKTFERTRAGLELAEQSDADLKHLYLDFRGAKFCHLLSYFEGLHSAQNKRFVDKIQAAVHYLREFYLPQFMLSGHHILYTIPRGKQRSPDFPHRLTYFLFHMYSNKSIGGTYTWNDNSRKYQPVIIIAGTYEDRQLSGFQYSTEWVAHASRFSSCGTVGISADAFLETKLLAVISQINATTTIIPSISGIKQNKWVPTLTTWAKHIDRKDEAPPPPTRDDLHSEESLRYVWKHHDKLNYEHTSPSLHITDGMYIVTCDTKNTVEFPTVYKQGTMVIELRGEVTLQLTVHLNDHGLSTDWSSKASVEWVASIVMHSEAAGLQVSMVNSPIIFKTLETSGDSGSHYALDPQQLLKSQFPDSIDLKAMHAEFSRFTSVWQSCYPGPSAFTLCNPVFNRKGDMLFELQPYTDPSSVQDADGSALSVSLFGKPSGRRDPFAQRPGTTRAIRAASRQTARAGAGVGTVPPLELPANGRIPRSIDTRLPTRSMSPSLRTAQPTRPSSIRSYTISAAGSSGATTPTEGY